MVRHFVTHKQVQADKQHPIHMRPKLTIRGIDQIFMIYLRVSSETWLLYVCGVVLHIGPLSARSTRHCMEFKITKDKIAQWNKMPLFLNKIK